MTISVSEYPQARQGIVSPTAIGWKHFVQTSSQHWRWLWDGLGIQ
jgi:hypothetical protein